MNTLFEDIKALCQKNAISGDEDCVREYILEAIKGHAEIKIDNLGNIIAFKKGKTAAKNKLMVSAHMDEVGFIVTAVLDSGLLKFTTVGGVDPRVVLGKSVVIAKNGVVGVIAVKAVHLQTAKDGENAPEIDDLYIDIGASDKEDALKYVTPGDSVCFNSDYVEFGEGFIKAKAIDDRAGCAVMINLIKSELPYDTYFTFTIGEEVGLVGARTAAFGVEPDIAIVVESTTAADIPGVTDVNRVCEVKKGPALSIRDRSTMYDTKLVKEALRIGEEKNIKCQLKQGVFGGNDAGAIHVSRAGVRTVAVSVPTRYLHSPVSVASKEDIENTFNMVKELVSAFPAL